MSVRIASWAVVNKSLNSHVAVLYFRECDTTSMGDKTLRFTTRNGRTSTSSLLVFAVRYVLIGHDFLCAVTKYWTMHAHSHSLI